MEKVFEKECKKSVPFTPHFFKVLAPIKLHTSTHLEIYSASTESELPIPLVSAGISAGFPSPASDFIDLKIDLNKYLIQQPSATFFARVKGDSMKDEGIQDEDLLVIDRSIEPIDGKIAVCFIDGDFTVKKIKLEKGTCWLMPANDNYQPIKVTSENELMIWGVVTHVIKSF